MTDIDIKRQILIYIGYKAKIASELEDQYSYTNSYSVNSKSGYRHSMNISTMTTRNCLLISQMSKSMVEPTFISDSFSLNDVFTALFESSKHSDLVRVCKNEKEIHLVLLKRFWFSSCVMLQVFYNILLAPLQKKEWVNCMDFLRSIEATYQKNVLSSFVHSKDLKKFSENMRIQQFLCILYLVYFCVVEFNYGEMNIHGLVSVLRLTKRMSKNIGDDLLKIARKIFEYANKSKTEIKNHITLKEFYSVLLNKL